MVMTEVRTGNGVLVTRNESIERYHADKKFIGSSLLKLFAESPMAFDDYMNGVTEDKGGSHFDLGTHWHDIKEHKWDKWIENKVIIPDRFCRADGSMSTKKEARDWVDNQIANSREIISNEHLKTLEKMEARFQMNTAAERLNNPPHGTPDREISIRFKENGVRQRVRPDLLINGTLVDFKSTREADPRRSFYNAVRRYRYDLSAAMYERGCQLANLCDGPMHFVVTSTVGDCQTQVLTLHSAIRSRAEQHYNVLLRDLAQRREDNDWSPMGYGEIGVVTNPWEV